MQKNRSVPEVQIKRKTWIENIAGAKPEHQIYLDERVLIQISQDTMHMQYMENVSLTLPQ